jgi:hypothetical protein
MARYGTTMAMPAYVSGVGSGALGFCSGASSSCAARDGAGSDDGCKLSIRVASLGAGDAADSEGGAERATRSTGWGPADSAPRLSSAIIGRRNAASRR